MTVTRYERDAVRDTCNAHGFPWVIFRQRGAPWFAYNRADARALARWSRSLGIPTRIERM